MSYDSCNFLKGRTFQTPWIKINIYFNQTFDTDFINSITVLPMICKLSWICDVSPKANAWVQMFSLNTRWTGAMIDSIDFLH